VDDPPIRIRTALARPDFVDVLDAGSFNRQPVADGSKDGGRRCVNTPRVSDGRPPGASTGFDVFQGPGP